jgi:hypothetical protein
MPDAIKHTIGTKPSISSFARVRPVLGPAGIDYRFDLKALELNSAWIRPMTKELAQAIVTCFTAAICPDENLEFQISGRI